MDKENLIGYQWAIDVVEGRFVASKFVKLECQRYINRMEQGEDFPCFFDFKECQLIYSLLGIINFATGFYANQSVISHAVGFQMMIWENIFCWKYKDNIDRRMIEEVYLLIGRKSAKSFICAVTEILIMLRSTKYSQHALAGKTRDISSLVRNATVEILKSSPLLLKHFKITRDKVECKLNQCTMKHLSGEADNVNGLLLSSFIVDEVANQEDGSIIGALKLSQMSTQDRLSIYISTQYDLEINAFNDLLDYHKTILNGVDTDTINTFGLLFEMDEKDDFNDESNWIKSSPLQMSIEDGRNFLRQEYKKGLTIPSAMKEFRIKILNERLSGYSGETYLDFDVWRKCEVPKVDLQGKEVVVSVDASLSTDLTAINIMYKENNEYYLIAHAFLPRNTLGSRREKIDYEQMERSGYCTITDGDIVDYNLLEAYIRGIEDKYNCVIRTIVSDPYNLVATLQKLGETYNVVLLKQSYTSLSPSIKGFRDDVYLGKVHYEKNRLLDWCMSNTSTVTGRSSGDILLNKVNKNKSRIDLVVATVFAYSQLYLDVQSFDAISALDNMKAL